MKNAISAGTLAVQMKRYAVEYYIQIRRARHWDRNARQCLTPDQLVHRSNAIRIDGALIVRERHFRYNDDVRNVELEFVGHDKGLPRAAPARPGGASTGLAKKQSPAVAGL